MRCVEPKDGIEPPTFSLPRCWPEIQRIRIHQASRGRVRPTHFGFLTFPRWTLDVVRSSTAILSGLVRGTDDRARVLMPDEAPAGHCLEQFRPELPSLMASTP